MDRLKQFIQDAYNELVHKVTWPTWSELQSSTVVVLVGTIIIALLVFAMDQASELVIKTALYNSLLK